MNLLSRALVICIIDSGVVQVEAVYTVSEDRCIVRHPWDGNVPTINARKSEDRGNDINILDAANNIQERRARRVMQPCFYARSPPCKCMNA